jgi:hypothetical protein
MQRTQQPKSGKAETKKTGSFNDETVEIHERTKTERRDSAR